MALIRLSPLNKRRWRNFKANRRALFSLWVFGILFFLSLFAELLANDRPLLVQYRGAYYTPIFSFYPETEFGGDFRTEAVYRDIEVQCLIISGGVDDCWDDPEAIMASAQDGSLADRVPDFHRGWLIWPPVPYSYNTVNDINGAAPSAPDADHWLGTDDTARDVLARVIYGFRLSVAFALIVTFLTSVIGIAAGAVQGYFGGLIDLLFQRVIELWGATPSLYIIIIVAAIFRMDFWLLVFLMTLFGWTALVGVVRAEFLRARNFEYVRAARALGVSNRVIMFRHVLPNAMVATLTMLPFIVTGTIGSLAALDFLGFGLPSSEPSLGELTLQAKNNLQAPWLAFTAFTAFAFMLSLLVFIFEGVRDAFRPQKDLRMTLLQVRNLSVSFTQDGATTDAVRNVSFEVGKGETVALVGESGSGKSVTALSTVSLLPDSAEVSGSVRYAGTEMVGAPEADLRRVRGNDISFIFQEPMTSLNPLHTIEKQLGESLSLHQNLTGAAAEARILELLRKVGIRDPETRLRAYPHQLSGGQRQRVMIAMALANGPDLLVADEPTTALDVTIQAQILDLLAELKRSEGMSLLFITHDLGIVRRIADKVCVMQGGEIVEAGPTAEIFRQSPAPLHTDPAGGRALGPARSGASGCTRDRLDRQPACLVSHSARIAAQDRGPCEGRERRLDLGAVRRNPGCRGRIRVRQDHAGACDPALAVFRRQDFLFGQSVAGHELHPYPAAAQGYAGGVSGPLRILVTAHDDRTDRGRRAERP